MQYLSELIEKKLQSDDKLEYLKWYYINKTTELLKEHDNLNVQYSASDCHLIQNYYLNLEDICGKIPSLLHWCKRVRWKSDIDDLLFIIDNRDFRYFKSEYEYLVEKLEKRIKKRQKLEKEADEELEEINGIIKCYNCNMKISRGEYKYCPYCGSRNS